METKCFRCLIRYRQRGYKKLYTSDIPKAIFIIQGTAYCVNCAWDMTDEDYLLRELQERTRV